MITDFSPIEKYVGNGLLDQYDFAFKITDLEHLLIYKINSEGEEVWSVRGNDTEFLDNVDFDPVEGEGTIFLQDVLEEDYQLLILLADDGPIQPFRFRDKERFKLSDLEKALDWITGWGQRLKYLVDRSLKLHDIDDATEFDMTLPAGVSLESSALKLIQIKETYDGWQIVSPEDILAGIAAQSEEEFLLQDLMSDEEIDDMIVYGALNSSAQYLVEVQGSDIGVHIPVSVNRLNGQWSVSMGVAFGDGDPGIDNFDVVDPDAEDAQITVTDDGTGKGDRTIQWKKVSFNAMS